jgi:hypothetical protein
MGANKAATADIVATISFTADLADLIRRTHGIEGNNVRGLMLVRRIGYQALSSGNPKTALTRRQGGTAGVVNAKHNLSMDLRY